MTRTKTQRLFFIMLLIVLFLTAELTLRLTAQTAYAVETASDFAHTYAVTGDTANGYTLATDGGQAEAKADAAAVISGMDFTVSPIKIIFGSKDAPVPGQFTFLNSIATNCDVYINGYVTGNSASGTIRNESSLINLFFTGGTVEATGDAGVAVYNSRNGKITISEPKETDSGNITLITSKNSAYSSGTVHLAGGTAGQRIFEMTGGTVENKGGVANPHYAKAIYLPANGTVAISGGTVYGGPGSAICTDGSTNGNIEISEPDQNTKTLIYSKKTTSAGFDTIEINGYTGSKNFTMTGGTVRSESSYTAIDVSGSAAKNITISGGTVDGGSGKAINILYNNAMVNISGTALITSASSASSGTIYFYNTNSYTGGALNILGGTIENTNSTGNIINNNANSSYPGVVGTVNIAPSFSGWENLPYDGTVKTVAAEIAAKFIKAKVLWQPELTVKYRIKDGENLTGAPSGAGEYTVFVEESATSLGNVPCKILAGSQDYEITKGVGSGTLTINDWKYGDTANAPVYDVTVGDYENPVYKYKVKDADDSAYSATVPTTAGEYTVKAIFAETVNYNTLTAYYDFIINPRQLINELQNVTGTFTYNGSAYTPEVTVTGLTEDKDYTVSYSNNTNAGTATVTISGKGNYSGALSKTFIIGKANGTGKVSIEGWKGNNANAPAISDIPTGYGAPAYEYKAKGADDSTYTTEKPAKPGEYTVRAKFEATANYEAYTTAGYDFTIEKSGISGGAIAGIVIGSVIFIALAGFSVLWFAIKKKKFSDLTAVFKRNRTKAE